MSEHTWSQPPVGAVLLEALVPLLNGGLVIAGMGPEEFQILLGQARLAGDAAHCVCAGGQGAGGRMVVAESQSTKRQLPQCSLR